MNLEVLIPISMFAAIFGVLYIFYMTRNKERLAMIEKGADPEIFAKRKSRNGVKLGLLAIGVAIGILTGQLIGHATVMDLEPAVASMIFLFAGTGLVVEHYLAKKEADKA